MRAFVKQNIKLNDDIKSDDMIRFKFDYYNSDLITTDDMTRKKEDLLKYHNMTIKGKFNSRSRIDNTPIIEINLDQPDRNDKINEVLDENI